MTARSSAVSRAGTNRWRPAQATASPLGARITTPRSTPGVREPDRTASRTRSNAAWRGKSAAVMPRSASRRTSATAAASVPFRAEESRGSLPARTSGQQHSIRCTCSTPRTSVAPTMRQARATAAGATSRRDGRRRGKGIRTRASSVATTPAAPAAHAQAAALPCSHSAAAMAAPLHLKTLVPDEVRFILERDARLLVPVGTCEQHGPHLPLGCDTIIVERLADDLSGALEILRAPTIEYGVNTVTRRPFPGNASVRRKTLHRWMNDLLGSWEEAGVESFIILTAHGHDPHQEALSTLRTRQARVFTVDVFALDFSDDLEDADRPMHGSELDTSLLLYLAPPLVRMERAQDFVLPEKQRTRYLRASAGSLPKRSPGSLGRPSIATRDKGERLYKMIYDRVATRVLGVPVP